MRILFWTELFPPLVGGAAILNARLVRALSERGHEVGVMASLQGQDLPEVDDFHGVPLYRLPFWTTINARDPEAFFALRAQVRTLKESLRPDLIHLSFTGASGLLHLQTSRIPVPTVAAVHVSPTPEGSSGVLAGRVLRAADAVTGTSQCIVDAIGALVPEAADRTSLVYNGISAPDVGPRPMPDGPPRLLVLGRVSREKGLDVAVRAAVQLVPRFPGLTLTVVGDGPAMPDLRSLVDELDARDTVRLAGWVDPSRVWEQFSEHHMLLVPSIWEEAFGMVAVEAALMERPVVASRVGGLAEVVADRETGRIVRPNDPGALADAVAGLLENPARMEELGRAGRRRCLDLFGWERYVDAYEDIYQTVAAGAAAAGVPS